MAMTRRSGAFPASRPLQSNIISSKYEDFQPRFEWKAEPEAHILLVQLPGFMKEQIKVTYVHSSQIIRVQGERPLQNNKWSRFNQPFPIPENSKVDKIHGKFQNGILTVTIPKERISKPTSHDHVPEKTTKSDQKVVDQKNVRSDQENAKPVQESKAPELKDHKTSSSKPTSHDHEPEKKTKSDQKVADRKNVRSGQENGKPVQESKARELKDHKTSSSKQADDQKSYVPKSDQKEVDKDRISSDAMNAKPVESKADQKVTEMTPDHDQKEKQSKQKDVTKPDDHVLTGHRTTKKIVETEKIKMDYQGIFGEEIRGIKNMAASAKQAVKSFKERLSEEEKQLLVNMGAAVLVIVALGAYASYSYGSTSSGKRRN